MDKKAFLNKLYKEYGLSTEDIFKHKHYTIIVRGGIEKIMAKGGIEVAYEVVSAVSAPNNVVIKATAAKEEKIITTFGSAHKDNCNSAYYAEMAEKRAMSRAVLKIEGLYEHGVFSEDEADDFKDAGKTHRARIKT